MSNVNLLWSSALRPLSKTLNAKDSDTLMPTVSTAPDVKCQLGANSPLSLCVTFNSHPCQIKTLGRGEISESASFRCWVLSDTEQMCKVVMLYLKPIENLVLFQQLVESDYNVPAYGVCRSCLLPLIPIILLFTVLADWLFSKYR